MAEPYLLRSHAKLMLEDFEGAKHDATASIERNAFIGQAYLVRALANHSLENYQAASADYRIALSMSPDDHAIRFNLAGTLFQQELYAKADSVASTIPSSASIYPIATLLRGDIALHQGDTIQAQELSLISLEADTTLSQAYAFRAELLRHKKQYPEALDLLNKAIEIAPQQSSLYTQRGLVRYLGDDYVGAIEDYNQAVALDNTNITAFYNRALLRSFLGDHNNALKDFEVVLHFDNNNSIARYNLALMQSQLGLFREAIANFTTVLDKYPNFMIGYLARAEAKLRSGDTKGSEKDRYRAYLLQRDGKTKKGKDNDPTNSDSKANDHPSDEEKTIEDYQSLIAQDASYYSQETTLPSSLRGKVQDHHTTLSPMGFHHLTFFISEEQLAHCIFDPRISQYNDLAPRGEILCSTATSLPLDSLETNLAKTRLDELNSQLRNDPYYFLRRGLYKFSLVDLEGALADFNKALDLSPDFALARFARAFTRLRLLEVWQSDETLFSDVNTNLDPSLTPSEATSLGGAKARYQTGATSIFYQEVISDLERIITLHPDMAIALYNRALLYDRMGDREKALEFYGRAIAQPNAPREAFYNRGLLLLSFGKRQEAIKDLSQAGELGIFQAYSILKRLR